MTDIEILAFAKELAEKLSIIVKNESLILKNIKPTSNPTTTILYNRNYILWIDKYYIAYSDIGKLDVWYAFITEHHIREELPQLNKMLKKDCTLADYIMLSNIKEQMGEAQKKMRLSGEKDYIFKNQIFRRSVEIEMLKDTQMVLTLCPRCAAQFYNSPEQYIKRVDPYQIFKESCTYCNSRNGFDFEIEKIERKNIKQTRGKSYEQKRD